MGSRTIRSRGGAGGDSTARRPYENGKRFVQCERGGGVRRLGIIREKVSRECEGDPRRSVRQHNSNTTSAQQPHNSPATAPQQPRNSGLLPVRTEFDRVARAGHQHATERDLGVVDRGRRLAEPPHREPPVIPPGVPPVIPPGIPPGIPGGVEAGGAPLPLRAESKLLARAEDRLDFGGWAPACMGGGARGRDQWIAHAAGRTCTSCWIWPSRPFQLKLSVERRGGLEFRMPTTLRSNHWP